MKKTIIFAIIATVILSSILALPSTTAQNLKGDINFDGQIDIEDLLLLKKHVLKIAEFAAGSDEFIAADMNDDGSVDVEDLLILKKIILKIYSPTESASQTTIGSGSQTTSETASQTTSESAAQTTDESTSQTTGESVPQTTREENTMTTNNPYNPYYPDEILALASREDYNLLITKTISDEDIKKGLMHKFHYLNSAVSTIMTYNRLYGIECLRQIDDERVYAIQKTDSGALVYTFFEQGIQFHSIIAIKNLSYADFDDVKIGSDISIVESINPVSRSMHLLKDGVLVFSYEKDSEGNYKVTEKQYFDDFITERVTTDFGLNYHFDYSILEQDYPK